ncbi:MAG: helix-turn-helix domain-containing protein [Ktedonobacteraceae bacterium]
MPVHKNNEPKVEILLFTVPEAAQALGLSRATLYHLIQTNIIPIIRIGRSVRINPQALRQLVAELEAGRLVIPSSTNPRPKRRKVK